jgi:hypothetical protein
MAQHRLNYHHLISQSTVSAAGPPLVNAVVDAQSQLYYGCLPGFRRAYARVRLLSVLRYFLRKQGMRDSACQPRSGGGVTGAGRECCSLPSSFRSRVGRRYRVWPDLGQISAHRRVNGSWRGLG